MLVKHTTEFDRFTGILSHLEDDEVYFISLSARNKYLEQHEREYYQLNKTEMFGRTLITPKAMMEKPDFYYAMEKLEATLSYKKTKNGNHIPDNALVVYCNINPSSTIKAYETFQEEMNKQLYENYKALRNEKHLKIDYYSFTHMDRKLMNCIQKSRSRKVFLDIDFDCDEKTMQKFVDNLYHTYTKTWVHLPNQDPFHIIQTHGGFHLLIKHSIVHLLSMNNYYLHKEVEQAHKNLRQDLQNSEKGEIVINKNEMVPTPGTMHGGKLVKFINDWSK